LIAILDYGMGNLRSVQKALEHLGADCRIQPDLAGASKVILPGVGAFGPAMERLQPLAADLRRWAADGQPLMGICLGQQLLFEASEEKGEHAGLGILPGRVRRLPEKGLKVPHVGWSAAAPRANSRLFAGAANGAWYYFVHSYYTECADPSHSAAETAYGIPFASAVESGLTWGAQFHPEKSGPAGLTLLENFIQC
jgi:glutamine amidotransferase